MKKTIPVIDLFAGPGGLGEGFSNFLKNRMPQFEVSLSIEKDPIAFQTLLTRSTYRNLKKNSVPDSYYDYITKKITKDEFINSKEVKSSYSEALEEARNVTLGDFPAEKIDKWINEKINGHSAWVLIGGPPCQAYSVAGRSKMLSLDKDKFENDHRHLLYKEYLRIIKKHEPPVFVMENVKGILSSKYQGESIFEKIIEDLSNPTHGLSYEIRSLSIDKSNMKNSDKDFVIKSELYSIPQARHRVILLGIRKDFSHIDSKLLVESEKITVQDALFDLPQIRSKLSKSNDCHENWLKTLDATLKTLGRQKKYSSISEIMAEKLTVSKKIISTGGEFLSYSPYQNMPDSIYKKWVFDKRIGGVINHTSRGHISEDIQRYFYLACHLNLYGFQPNVTQLPHKLLPKHKNISSQNTPFLDRFKVQPQKSHSTTIVSHISKDGHHYIHPDASQARSLTVREAARLQTFPDNYYFEGSRTQQYVQIGNAVPPLLAFQIAEIVANLLSN
jgi:DNA (cytosine-5)-methyltransferase 1